MRDQIIIIKFEINDESYQHKRTWILHCIRLKLKDID